MTFARRILSRFHSGSNRVLNSSYGSTKLFSLLRLQIESWRLQKNPPLLIYTMGKVGTSTVYNSLSQILKRFCIYHLHTLSEDLIRKEEILYRSNFSKLRAIDGHLLSSLFLRKKLYKQKVLKQRWKIITLVRDPMRRNISAFFQVLDLHTRKHGFYQRIIDGEGNELIYDLSEFFIKSYNHNRPEEWFNSEIKEHFKIDVLSSDFPTHNGFRTYNGEKADLLVLRLEDLNTCAVKAFNEFLGIEGLVLNNSQIGNTKYYARVYKEFLQNISFPQTLIDDVYDSPFVRKFYNIEEIEVFKSQWKKQVPIM